MSLNEMEIFFYVVQFKSFSKAAEHLNLSKSFISKKISALENDLSTQLIARSTRHITITKAGEDFYRYCKNLVDIKNEAHAMISDVQNTTQGSLRISMPPALGLHFLAPMLTEFMVQHPAVILDIQLESSLVDVIKEGYDLILRAAILKSSSLIAQKIFSLPSVICASATYFDTYGTPMLPSDLEKHRFALYQESKPLILKKDTKEYPIHLKKHLKSNSMDLIKKIVLSNQCMSVLPAFMVKEELKTGTLKTCLDKYKLPSASIFVMYPERKFMQPKVRHFIEMLKEMNSNG